MLEVKLEFKGHNYMFNSYEMELYSEVNKLTVIVRRRPGPE